MYYHIKFDIIQLEHQNQNIKFRKHISTYIYIF